MSPHDYLAARLENEMTEGQMHGVLRDVGRLAGGLVASGGMPETDLFALASQAESLSLNKAEGARKWREGVAFGRNEPVQWDQCPQKPDHALDWDSVIGGSYSIVAPNRVQAVDVPEPVEWNPLAQISEYLTALFSAEEYVGFCVESFERDGKRLPTRGNFSQTAGELLANLERYNDVGAVFGDVDPAVGAWIRPNPLDGQGVCDKNVTDFRFALVESDKLPIDQQHGIYKQLELPIAALVHSGNKSLHAIVRIEADSLQEYRRRVDLLYHVCEKNGLATDLQNRNPSRYSRMPGVERNGRKQYLVATNTGKPDWNAWEAWVKESAKAATRTSPVLTCMADVEPRSISWLWPGRIPMGRESLLSGPPGDGKSFLTTDIASRVSTGESWPDGSPCPRGSVILISAEDDPADTIRPRLDAHHADVRRVHLLSAVRRVDDAGQHDRMITLADVDAIEAALVKLPDCKLIVVDPIGSFLGGRTDAHRDNEVRGVLAPVAMLAEKYGPAVLIVAHRRKSLGTSADDGVLGSRAFTGLARAVWHLSRDPENKTRRLLLPGKNNLAHEGDGLAFSIGGEPPRLWWEDGSVTMSADQGLAAEQAAHKPGPDADAQNAAVAWLDTALADGPRPAKELTDEWINGEGGAKRTLDRARQALGVEAYRPENPGPWFWRSSFSVLNAAGAHCQDPKDKELGDLGNVPQNTENLPLF